jgi:dTDP-glucose pyrophosphorylase
MHQSNATIPVNGKPVISWILDDLIRKDISEIEIVIREENTRLKQLLVNHYSKRVSLHITALNNPASILQSLEAGLAGIENNNEGVQVILGDTLIQGSFENLADTLLVSPVHNSENWCIAITDVQQNLQKFIDKKELPGNNHLALCGYYCFSDITLLKESVRKSIEKGARELSDTLMNYHNSKPLKLKTAEQWFDFGHLESFIQSKKLLLRPRHFNQLTIHPLLNTITKVSEKSDKLEDELNWYKELPEELKVLTPRIIAQDNSENTVSITQEFYGYPSLSELFVYGDLSTSVWESIIDYLFQVHQLFKTYHKKVSPAIAADIYVAKTQQRITQLLQQNPFWKSLWEEKQIDINGISYPNISMLLEQLEPQIAALCNASVFHIIHGDYCLSNILYDLSNQIVKLIDPRGSFGEKGIYGDARYDIAKLRHSIAGSYDYIVGDLFNISCSGNSFVCSIFEDEKNAHLEKYFDQCIASAGYNPAEIRLIEGLLFLSMIPYHSDHFERQQMMYVRCIQILSSLITHN